MPDEANGTANNMDVEKQKPSPAPNKSGGGGFKTEKLVQLLTVGVYLAGISSMGVVLSLFFIFFWTASPSTKILPRHRY